MKHVFVEINILIRNISVTQNSYTTVTVRQYCYTAVTFQMKNAQLTIEGEMQLLCVTGVEDKLQLDIRTTLELLANAGIKVRREKERRKETEREREREREGEGERHLIDCNILSGVDVNWR